MWYFIWIVGTLFICGVGVFFALRLERHEASKAAKDNADA